MSMGGRVKKCKFKSETGVRIDFYGKQKGLICISLGEKAALSSNNMSKRT